MKRGVMLVGALGLIAVFGCAGDVAKMITSNAEMRDQVMTTISSHSDLAGAMVDKLLASDSTRTMILSKLMGNSSAMQSMMMGISRDPTMVDGVLNLAVQDSSMKSHVMTLLKGMQMAGAK
jgi:hypothetical protein